MFVFLKVFVFLSVCFLKVLTDFLGIVVIGIVIVVVIGPISMDPIPPPRIEQGRADLQSAALTTGLCTLVQSSVLITIVVDETQNFSRFRIQSDNQIHHLCTGACTRTEYHVCSR